MRSLSAKLLVLTISFVLLAEILIFLPSVARYRISWIEDKLKAGHLAALATAEAPEMRVSDSLRKQLLGHVDAYSVDVIQPEVGFFMMLEASDMPTVDFTYDISSETVGQSIYFALCSLFLDKYPIIKIEGMSPLQPDVKVAMVVDNQPLRSGMVDYGIRILWLSILISFMTAGLLYWSLRKIFVHPMQDIKQSMVRFRQAPDLAENIITPSDRQDEMGEAQHELKRMQEQLRKSLRQSQRLAALGTAVTKIQHDLRNILSTAALVTEGLALSKDPTARKTSDMLYETLDRAVSLCQQTLDFSRDGGAPLKRSMVELKPLLEKISQQHVSRFCKDSEGHKPVLHLVVPTKCTLLVDEEQIQRVFENLLVNACQAGANQLTCQAIHKGEVWEIMFCDNGPGFAPRAREHLFQPFAGSVRQGGTGLGLPIAREIVRAHGGEMSLSHSAADGSTFTITLPTVG